MLLKRIRKDNIRILHAHFGLFMLAESAAILCPSVNLVLHFHSDFSAGKQPDFNTWIHSILKKIPELLIGKKRLAKITVSENSAKTEKDCISVRNALVPERAAPEYRSGKEIRQEYSIPEDAKLLLVFGWSPFIKGVDIAAEAVSSLRHSSGKDFRLGIVFGRTCREEQMRKFIRAYQQNVDNLRVR